MEPGFPADSPINQPGDIMALAESDQTKEPNLGIKQWDEPTDGSQQPNNKGGPTGGTSFLVPAVCVKRLQPAQLRSRMIKVGEGKRVLFCLGNPSSAWLQLRGSAVVRKCFFLFVPLVLSFK